METLENFKNNYDWQAVFEFGGDTEYEHTCGNAGGSKPNPIVTDSNCETSPVLLKDVTEVLHSHEGERDEDDWICVVKLNDGRYASLIAGCDYTGWDCRSGGKCFVSNNLEQLLIYGLDDEHRNTLGIKIKE